MPIYEYRCKECGNVSEIIQKVDAPPLKRCPKCGGSVTKLLSPPAIQFKGSGWYVTDYAQKPTKAKQNKHADSTKSKESTKKAPKSSDSAPDEK